MVEQAKVNWYWDEAQEKARTLSPDQYEEWADSTLGKGVRVPIVNTGTPPVDFAGTGVIKIGKIAKNLLKREAWVAAKSAFSRDGIKAAFNVFKGSGTSMGLSDDIIRLSEANIVDSGKAVLGHFNDVSVDYITKAKAKNASFFDLGDTWDVLTPIQREAANLHFLDEIANLKQDIFLNVSKTKIRIPSALDTEIRYLIQEKGYKWVNQWMLRPPP